jgi:mono/diheme cytochrome c family protein
MAEVVLHGTQFLTDADAGAMAQYLQSLPRGPATSGLTKLTQLDTTMGADIYQDRCAQCHGDQGQGRANAYPALVGNRALLTDPPNNAVLSVLHGGFSPSNSRNPRPFGMPPYLLELNDAQVAQVLNFTRNSWGNRGQAISALQVQQLRQEQGKR